MSTSIEIEILPRDLKTRTEPLDLATREPVAVADVRQFGEALRFRQRYLMRSRPSELRSSIVRSLNPSCLARWTNSPSVGIWENRATMSGGERCDADLGRWTRDAALLDPERRRRCFAI